MLQSLMVLGADTFQIGLIQYLKNQGFEVHVLSNRPNDPACKIAHYFHNCDYSKIEQVLTIYKAIDARCIFVSASDAALLFQNKCLHQLNIPCYSTDFIHLFLEKTNYKLALTSNLNQYSPNILNKKQINEIIEHQIWPKNGFFAKRINGSGSKFLYYLKQPSDFNEFKKNNNLELYFFEEFIEGEEIGGDFICIDGKLIFYKPSLKFVNEQFVPIAHLMFKKNRYEKLASEMLVRFIHTFQLPDGIYNVDIMIHEQNAYLIDVSPRLGGNCIPEIVEKTWGINEYEIYTSLQFYNLLKPIKIQFTQAHGVFIIGANKNGKITSMISDKLPFQNKIVEVFWKYNIGDEVSIFNEGGKHLGYVIFKANSDEELLSLYNEISQFNWYSIV